MIRRAAWRAVGLTELPAAQRKRAVCRVARRPFEAARRPRPGKWSPPRGEPRRTGRRPLDAARRLRRPAAGRGPSRRAPAPRSAPPRPLHPWRGPGSARPRPRTAPAGSGGRREIFPGGRRRRVRGAVGARRGAGGAVRGAAGAAGRPGAPPTAAPAAAAARAPDIARIARTRGLRSARAAAFLQRFSPRARARRAGHRSRPRHPCMGPALERYGPKKAEILAWGRTRINIWITAIYQHKAPLRRGARSYRSHGYERRIDDE